MEFDKEKVDEMALALMYLTSFIEGGQKRTWKGLDWDVLNRLYEKELISNPKSKAKSVAFTEEGFAQSKALFEKYFEKTS